jgi:transposase
VKAARRLGLKVKTGHLDSTSLHVDGNYNHEELGLDEVKVIRITQGYSRDHRAELNQAILNLIVEHQAGIPMMMQASSGNTSDKEGFRAIVETHIAQLQQDYGVTTLVMDSAGFTAKNLEALQAKGSFWIAAVPANVALARDLLAQADTTEMKPLSPGYQYLALCTTYAGVQQRWLLIYSSEAEKRAKRTVARQQAKASDKALKAWHKLSGKRFACQQDAQAACEQFQREHPCLVMVHQELISHKHYDKAGRPQSKHTATLTYSLKACFAMSLCEHQQLITSKSCFILASNQLDLKELSDVEILEGYKGQKYVERGFRFIKDPLFLISTIFLKKPERVMALLMVMSVCLLVYAALEYRIQAVLKANKTSVPDQKRKPTSRPTARWVFQLFIDVHLLTITSNNSVQNVTLNLKPELERLLRLLGPPYICLYS